MNSYNNSNNPEFLNNYLMHLKIVKILSERTIEEYYLDIRLFLRYVHGTDEKDITEVNISDMTEAELKKITVSDIFICFFNVLIISSSLKCSKTPLLNDTSNSFFL